MNMGRSLITVIQLLPDCLHYHCRPIIYLSSLQSVLCTSFVLHHLIICLSRVDIFHWNFIIITFKFASLFSNFPSSSLSSAVAERIIGSSPLRCRRSNVHGPPFTFLSSMYYITCFVGSFTINMIRFSLGLR